MDELEAEGDGFDLKCKALMAGSLVVLVAGFVLTIAAVLQPVHYVLFTVGLIGATAAWLLCLRETNLVGTDEDADPDPQEDEPSPPPEARE